MSSPNGASPRPGPPARGGDRGRGSSRRIGRHDAATGDAGARALRRRTVLPDAYLSRRPSRGRRTGEFDLVIAVATLCGDRDHRSRGPWPPPFIRTGPRPGRGSGGPSCGCPRGKILGLPSPNGPYSATTGPRPPRRLKSCRPKPAAIMTGGWPRAARSVRLRWSRRWGSRRSSSHTDTGPTRISMRPRRYLPGWDLRRTMWAAMWSAKCCAVFERTPPTHGPYAAQLHG
jgi:hypothetical protein